MQIKVVTTEKKLTKAIVQQMQVPISAGILENGNILGYVIRIIKDCSKVFIVEYKENYYILPNNYERTREYVYRRVGKELKVIRFKNINKLNEWWNAYMKIVIKDVPHIYI